MDDNRGLAEKAYEHPINGERPIETALIEFAQKHRGINAVEIYFSPEGMVTPRYYFILKDKDESVEEDLKELRKRFPTHSGCIESRLEGESQEHLLMTRIWDREKLSDIERKIIEFASSRSQVVEVRKGFNPEERDAILAGNPVSSEGTHTTYFLMLTESPYKNVLLTDELARLTGEINQDIIYWKHRPDCDYQDFVGEPIWTRE